MKRYKLTLLDSETIGIAKEDSIIIMKTDRSSAFEINIPFPFTIAGIAKKHDLFGIDQFFVFGKNSTDFGWVRVTNTISYPINK